MCVCERERERERERESTASKTGHTLRNASQVKEKSWRAHSHSHTFPLFHTLCEVKTLEHMPQNHPRPSWRSPARAPPSPASQCTFKTCNLASFDWPCAKAGAPFKGPRRFRVQNQFLTVAVVIKGSGREIIIMAFSGRFIGERESIYTQTHARTHARTHTHTHTHTHTYTNTHKHRHRHTHTLCM